MTFRDDTLSDLFGAPSERPSLSDRMPEAVWLEMGGEIPGSQREMGIAWKWPVFASPEECARHFETTLPDMQGVLAAFLQLAEAPDEDFVSFADRYGVPGHRFKEYVLTEGVKCDGWYPLRRMRDMAQEARAVLALAADLKPRRVGNARDWATVLGVTEMTIHEWRRTGGDWWDHYWEAWHNRSSPNPPPSREEWLCILLIGLLSQLGYPDAVPVWRSGHGRPHLQLDRATGSAGALSEVAVQLLREFLRERAETGDELRMCGAPDCVNQFVPTRKGHIYCSPACKSRVAQRRRRAGWSQPPRKEKRGPT